jgi:hypothetical protein
MLSRKASKCQRIKVVTVQAGGPFRPLSRDLRARARTRYGAVKLGPLAA